MSPVMPDPVRVSQPSPCLWAEAVKLRLRLKCLSFAHACWWVSLSPLHWNTGCKGAVSPRWRAENWLPCSTGVCAMSLPRFVQRELTQSQPQHETTPELRGLKSKQGSRERLRKDKLVRKIVFLPFTHLLGKHGKSGFHLKDTLFGTFQKKF